MLNRLPSLLFPRLAAAMRAGQNGVRRLPGLHSERGQTGMEIALAGAVCASCVLGAVILTTGHEAAQRLDSVLRGGIERAGGTLMVSGTVVATTEGTPAAVDEIVVTLAVAGEPVPVQLDFEASGKRLVIAYQDETVYEADVPYLAKEISGDHDGLLEAGETAQVRVAIAGIEGAAIGPLDAWTLQFTAPSGGIVEVSRTMPLALDPVTALR